MQVTAEQERDKSGRMAALCGVSVRFDFLRFAKLEEAFPAESDETREALPRMTMCDVPLLVRNDGALLQFGKLVKRVTELDSAP
jgi:hypothetical protein